MLFKKILVPLDSSELAERALAPALTLAQKNKGEVILLHVLNVRDTLYVEPTGYGWMLTEDAIGRFASQAADYLTSIQRLWAHPDVSLRSEVLEGDEASVIVDTATSEDVDLIAMSTHGRSGFTRWVLGSVTERVLHSAPCPVLVAHSPDPIRRILITLDGSALAEQALLPGLQLAKALGCSVTLLKVRQEAGVDSQHLPELERTEDALEPAESYLAKVAQAHQEVQERPIETAVVAGPVAENILKFVEAKQCDLLVMATHGHTGLRRWVYGSVTEKVLRSGRCAMLIIRSPEQSLK